MTLVILTMALVTGYAADPPDNPQLQQEYSTIISDFEVSVSPVTVSAGYSVMVTAEVGQVIELSAGAEPPGKIVLSNYTEINEQLYNFTHPGQLARRSSYAINKLAKESNAIADALGVKRRC